MEVVLVVEAMRPLFEAGLEGRLNRAFIGRSSTAADNRRMGRLLLCTAVLAALATAPAAARDGGHDHDRARAAVQAGEALPLPELLLRLQRDRPGRVLEIELERDGPRLLYEVKWLQPDGQVLRLDVDARSGDVLRERRRGRDR
jgi:uncharacterized membrane protein YkoI